MNKSPGPDSLTGEFYKTFNEEVTRILLKIFPKIEEKGTLLNSFYKASVTLIPKTDKATRQKKKITDQYH